jgi:hypothetical protein
MKNRTSIVFLLLFIVGICSCAHQPPAKFVVIASVHGHSAREKVGALIDRTNIPFIISGEEYESDIMVRADRREELVKILKQDAKVHEYDITFY